MNIQRLHLKEIQAIAKFSGFQMLLQGTLEDPQSTPGATKPWEGSGRAGGERMENGEAEHSSLFPPSTLLQPEQVYFCMIYILGI